MCRDRTGLDTTASRSERIDPVAVDVMSAVRRVQAEAGIPVVFSRHQLEVVEQLCDRVGIMRGGHMVACGTVTELADGSPERLWVEAPGAPEGWERRLRGVRARTLLELDPGYDDQMVLRAALATGPACEFRRDVPGLSELFRDVVSPGLSRDTRTRSVAPP